MSKDGETVSTEVSFSKPPPPKDVLVIPNEKPEERNLPVLATSQPAIRMTREEALQAARECGLGEIEIGKWDAYGKIGQYFQEVGAVKVATGHYVASNKARKHMIRICRRAMGKCEDPDAVAALASVINKSLADSDAAINQLLKFVHSGIIKEPDTKPQFQLPPRGTPVVAVKIDNKVGGNGNRE